MKSKILLTMFTLCLVLFYSCEYQPTGSNFRNIDSTYKIPSILIELPEEGKAIEVNNYERYDIKYKLSGDLSKFKYVFFYLDTTLICQSEKSETTFEFKKKAVLEKELYNLKMVVLNSSGTGSIADKLGLEGSYYEKNWPVVITNPELFKFDPLKYSIINGVLKIEWNKYDFSYFFDYEITKTVYHSYYQDSYTFTPISSSDENYLLDNSYVGENASYSIKLSYKKNGSIYSSYFPELELKEDFPVFSCKKISKTSIELNWTKSKYYGSIEEFKISNSKLFSDISVDGNTQSIRIDNLPIGVNDKIKINIIPLFKNISFTPEIEIPIVTGDSSFIYSEFQSGFGDNIFYTKNIDWYKFNLYKYSISNNSVLQSTEFSTPTSQDNRIKVSNDGKNVIYKSDNSLVCCLNGDLSNPTVISDVFLTGRETNYGFSDMAISSNGIIAAYIDDSVYIYNLVKNKLMCKWRDIGNDLSISNNGDFVAYNTNGSSLITKIYKVGENTKNLVSEDFLGLSMQFDANNNSRLYYFDYNDNKMNYIDCESKSITYISLYLFYQIDFESGLAISYKSENIYEIVDLNNGLNSVFTYKSISGTGRIKGDYIYFSTGVKCKFR